MGVLIERKGVTDLLKSLKILNEENLLNDYNINLFIAGDGPQKQELMKLSGKWGIKNYIKFIGWVDQQKKEELLLNSQLFVLPSYNEGLPIAILEAINYGVPIISTNVGSIDEAVIHNKNGFIINPGDSLSLSKYIKKIVTDNILWEELSYSSKEICKDKFNETEMFNRLCELYSRCVHEI